MVNKRIFLRSLFTTRLIALVLLSVGVQSALAEDLGSTTIDIVTTHSDDAHDIAFDNAGGAHCVFAEVVNLAVGRRVRMKYGSRRGPNTDWDVTIVEDLNTEFLRVSIAINGEGRPVIASMSDEGLRARTFDPGAGWDISPLIDAEPRTTTHSGIDLQYVPRTDSLVIAFARGGNDLYLATKPPASSWSTQAIGTGGDFPSMIPPAGLFGLGAVAHYVAGDLHITRQKFQGFNLVWETSTVTSFLDSGRRPSIRRLPNGEIGIAYQRRNGNTHSLYYAESVDQVWEISPIKVGSGDHQYGDHLTMTLDAQGEPQIIYSNFFQDEFDDDLVTLRIARRHPTLGWVSTSIDTKSYDRYSGIASDTNGAGEPIAIDFLDGRIRAIVQSSPAWVASTPIADLPDPTNAILLPTVGTAPDGTRHLAFCASSTDGEFRTYLGTWNGASYDLGFAQRSDFPPFDLALAFTPDGTTHLFSLRSTVISHYRRRADNSSVLGSIFGTKNDTSFFDSMDAVAEPDGTLHICFSNEGELKHGWKKPGDIDWSYTDFEGRGRATKALAMGLRARGIVGISGWSPNGEISLTFASTNNILPNDRIIASGVSEPPNTDVIFREDVGRVLWAADDKIFYRIALNGSPIVEIADAPSPAVVAFGPAYCAEARDELKTVDDIAFLTYGGPEQPKLWVGRRAKGVFESAPVLSLPEMTASPPRLEFGRDGFGFYAALGLHVDGLFDQAIFATTADSLDLDGNGLSNLVEDAYNVSTPDELAEKVYWSLPSSTSGGNSLFFDYNFSAPSRSTLNVFGGQRMYVGEFVYYFEIGRIPGCWQDLETFLADNPTLNFQVTRYIEAGFEESEFTLSLFIPGTDQRSESKLFLRSDVQRVRARHP